MHCNYNFRKWTAEVYLSLTLCIINIYLGRTCIKSRWYLPFLPTKQNKKIYCRFSSKYFACCECTHMYQVYNTQLAINDVWQHFKKMLACLWCDVHIHMARIVLWITLKRHFYDAIQSYHMRWRFANRSPPSGIILQ